MCTRVAQSADEHPSDQRECFKCDTEILFDSAFLASIGLAVHSLHPKYVPRTPPALMSPSPTLLDAFANGGMPPAGGTWRSEPLECEEISANEMRIELLNEEAEDWFDATAPMCVQTWASPRSRTAKLTQTGRSNDMLEISKAWCAYIVTL